METLRILFVYLLVSFFLRVYINLLPSPPEGRTTLITL
jgi:hypothetical protein